MVSKTKSSFYRRLYIAHLIDIGVNTMPQLIDATGSPRRTIQDTIKSLNEIDVICVFEGSAKTGCYKINDWGALNKSWIKEHTVMIKSILSE